MSVARAGTNALPSWANTSRPSFLLAWLHPPLGTFIPVQGYLSTNLSLYLAISLWVYIYEVASIFRSVHFYSFLLFSRSITVTQRVYISVLLGHVSALVDALYFHLYFFPFFFFTYRLPFLTKIARKMPLTSHDFYVQSSLLENTLLAS